MNKNIFRFFVFIIVAFVAYQNSAIYYVSDINTSGLYSELKELEARPDSIAFVETTFYKNGAIFHVRMENKKDCKYINSKNWDCRDGGGHGFYMTDNSLYSYGTYLIRMKKFLGISAQRLSIEDGRIIREGVKF